MKTYRAPEITDEHRDTLRAKKMPVYATIVPGRTTKPAVSLHTRLSHAKNAVQSNYSNQRSAYDYEARCYRLGEAEIYQLVDAHEGGTTWSLLYRVEEGTLANDVPWKR